MQKKESLRPIILREGEYVKNDVDILRRKPDCKIVDIYIEQMKEVIEIKEPATEKESIENKISDFKKQDHDLSGDWIYFNSSNTLLHTVTKEDNYTLRTNRNKNIINKEEQDKLAKFTLAIAGLSVGGNIATGAIYNGLSDAIKLADFDNLSTSNLNRMRASILDVGQPKIEVISQQLYEINPYLDIIDFSSGINEDNIKEFLGGNNKPSLIFEIIDDFKMKILLRKEAQKNRIPVIMMTSIGDNVLIDVERYDINPETKIFNGLVDEDILEKILSGKIKEEEKNQYAIKIVGKENVPEKVANSIKNIGIELVGRPQVMSTITVASGLAVLLARKIALGEKVSGGRTLIKLEELIEQNKP